MRIPENLLNGLIQEFFSPNLIFKRLPKIFFLKIPPVLHLAHGVIMPSIIPTCFVRVKCVKVGVEQKMFNL